MSKRIELPIGLDTSGVAKGAKDAEQALRDLEDAAGDTAKGGAKDLERLEDELKDVQRQSEKTERSVDDIGDGSTRGFGKAGEAAGEFKQEALANFSEVTSSFDGSMSSIQDLAQGTLGGLASTGLPGIGVAAGVAAVGIGAMGAAFEAAEERRRVLEERANDLAQAYIDAGGTVLDTLTVASRSSEILTDPEQRKEAEKLRDVMGVDLPTAVRALAGDTNAYAVIQKIANDAQTRNTELSRSQVAASSKRESAVSDEINTTEDQIAAFADLESVTGQANTTFKEQQAVLIGLVEDSERATKQVDKLGNTVYTLPDKTQVFIDAETGQASTDVSNFKGDLDEATKTRVTHVQVRVDDSAWRNWKPVIKDGIVQTKPASGRYWE